MNAITPVVVSSASNQFDEACNIISQTMGEIAALLACSEGKKLGLGYGEIQERVHNECERVNALRPNFWDAIQREKQRAALQNDLLKPPYLLLFEVAYPEAPKQ